MKQRLQESVKLQMQHSKLNKNKSEKKLKKRSDRQEYKMKMSAKKLKKLYSYQEYKPTKTKSNRKDNKLKNCKERPLRKLKEKLQSVK